MGRFDFYFAGSEFQFRDNKTSVLRAKRAGSYFNGYQKRQFPAQLLFHMATGSGKTIMMAEFLKQLVDDREIRQSLGFIWTAPRQLHIQSRDKLENYFESSRALKCS